jgi:hypothetical protein
MAIHSRVNGAKLIFPVVSPASEKIMTGNNNEIMIYKKGSVMKLTSSQIAVRNGIRGNRVFNFRPGFEAVPLEIPLDGQGNGALHKELVNVLKKINNTT